jgi:lysozyme family protein
MINRLIEREGGFVDHKDDRGGATKYGITHETLTAWRGSTVSTDDVRKLDLIEARAIYRDRYFENPRMRLSEWPYRLLAEVTLDASVMFSDGPNLAVRWVQQAINAWGKGGKLKVDGWAGPATRDAMALCNERDLVTFVVAERVEYHARVVASRPAQVVFLVGWIRRETAWLMPGKTQEEDAPLVPSQPPYQPMPEPGPDMVVFSRVRDGVKVYWTGSVSWGRADLHSPDTDDRRMSARELTPQKAAEMLELWPGLALYEMEAA